MATLCAAQNQNPRRKGRRFAPLFSSWVYLQQLSIKQTKRKI